MRVFLVSAVSNDNMSLVIDWERMPLRRQDPRGQVGPAMVENWSPPPLILYKGKKKFDADFWDFDQGSAFVVSARVASALSSVDGCTLVPLHAEVVDPNRKPAGEVSRTLLAVVRQVDAVDPERSVYKPYGERVLDLDVPGATVFDVDRVPDAGLFHQPSGAGSVILAGECDNQPERSFRSIVAAAGWTGLKFTEIGSEASCSHT